jgi:tRNA threonylcarbamoyladenosine biosynthesis protein TsaB
MLILTIRTDRPEAEIGLFEDSRQLAYLNWQAHRQLAETIHKRIHELLQSRQKKLDDLQAVVVFQGPGSFTGLRIGVSVANALADSLSIPIVASQGDNWIRLATAELLKGANDRIVVPEYGAEPHVTQPKH